MTQIGRDAMLSEARWQSIAGGLFFVESLCDRNANHSASETTVLNFPCEQCTGAFASSKALASHMRAKHGQRIKVKDFLPNSECPSCGTDFQQRVRCIAHVSDSRRPKCRDHILAHFPQLSNSVCDQLDEQDRVYRRQAQRSGRTNHIADVLAIKKNGSVVGRVG